ncbi:hypothetical protein BTUL_0275g00150 [Botrytis tulipae]|uniref:Uncharacterized protein n=1 Tax=Botrytis tulipae TaxID=87230 RepID=A0A4Z1EA51_9HELO|nr:hypothetical protein BTUL_0275g00150 [Botrytis tulipae]
MASIELPVRTRIDATTDVGAIWKAAIVRYEDITKVKIESAAKANNVDEILKNIREREDMFKGYRHDGSKVDKFRSLVSKSLDPIEKLGNVVGQAATTAFPPSTAIFTAAVNSVSSDYEKIAGLFEDLNLYLNRLKILESSVPPVPELKVALIEVLTSVLVLCAISTKYIKMKRIVKAFRNLISGEDNELSAAYTHFHKMIEQEQGAVRNATLAAVGQLQKESTVIHAIVRENLAMTERTGLDAKTLVASTGHLQQILENREAELQRVNVLARLSSLDFHDKQKDTFTKRYQGTGLWLLKTDAFQKWFKGDGPSILWCPGIPGAGKTVMTSLAVNHVREAVRSTKGATICIYCDYKDPKTWSELGLLSSIARQLTEQTNSIPSVVKEFCDQNAEKKRNPTGDEWISLIKSISLLFQTTYVFIDALDECPETNRDKFLCLLEKMEPFVMIFITSRPHLDLQAKFADISRINITANASDIKTYLEHEIRTNTRLSLLTAKDLKLQEDIVKNLSEKAAGINAMERVEKQQEEDSQLAKRALSYIFCARRPLNVKELLHVLAVEVEDTELDETAFPETEILLIISAGLIRIDEKSGTVGLVHYTLQEYLERNREKLLPDPEVEIARACLTYLSFDVFGGGPCSNGEGLHQRLQVYEFLDYASHNWGSHLSEDQLHEKVVDLVFTFLNDKEKLSCFVQILYVAARRTNDWHERFPNQFGPQHVAAYWGLDKILIVLFEKDIEVDSQDSYGTTALQLAAKHGHKSVVQLLLNKGANVNIRNGNGETALYLAARNGHKTIVELLIVDTANVLTKDNEGWTALDWAVVRGNNDVLKMLLEHITNINAENDGRNKALYLAAEEGHERTVEMLLDNGADVNAQDSLGSTALDFAVTPGHEKTVQLLLRNGAEVKLRDIYKNTVLHWAVPYKTLVQLLLEHGVDVDAENDNGQTALCWAAQDGPVEVVELLLDNNASVDAQDIYGFTALHRATLRGREMIVRLLLDNGANPNLKDKGGWTPLHVAALKHNGLVKVLLDYVDDGRAILDWVSLQLQDSKTQALLEEAMEEKANGSSALTGLRETIQERQLGRSQALLDKGADVNGKDIGGWTALIVAATDGCEKAVRLLLDNGADVNIRGYDQRSALHWASKYGHEAAVHLLVENGADINASAYGWTAMLLAAKDEFMSIVYFLIQNGSDINAEDYHGRTAFHWAAKYGSESVVKLLVEKGANVNAVDRWGRTAMIWAAENMQKTVVEMLLDFGANIEVKSPHTFTALHIAAFMGWESVVQRLLEEGVDAKAEAQYCGAEESKEYEGDAAEMAEKPVSDLLRPWLPDQGTVTDV